MRRDLPPFAKRPLEPEPQRLRRAIDDWLHHRISGEPKVLTDGRPAYVEHHLDRSMAAISLVPERRDRGRMLELGSGIYLMTFLVEQLRNYDLDLVQYWGRPSGAYGTTMIDDRTGASRVMPFREFNGEREPFPYPDATFDVILNCDTIEHMLCDPVHMLAECHRVLKPGGVMVVTTPNVLRLDNVVRLLQGVNIHDKYVLQSASARHPREYTPNELRRIHEWVGFEVTHLETRDVTRSTVSRSARRMARALLKGFGLAARFVGRGEGAATDWRGEQIIMSARRSGPVQRSAPDFLYEAPGSSGELIAALYGDGSDAS
jgi:SAM-dependent methyltransferase